MQLDLTVLTKIKESNPLLWNARIRGKSALNTHFYHLTRVSVPAEDGSHQSLFFTHVHNDQYRSTHSCPQKTNTEVPTPCPIS
jgi:hypothetical protein